jgi:hypothetical protein
MAGRIVEISAVAVRLLAAAAIIAVPYLLDSAYSRNDVRSDTSGEVVGADGIIGADGRMLLSEFTLEGVADQARMRASLSASQSLSCDKGGASASLIHRNDVVIFSAHELFDDDDKPPRVLGNCVFAVTKKDGGFDHYPVLLTTLDYGGPTPNHQADDAWNQSNQNDWAIARLARPVEGIEPYRLPDQADVGAPGTKVTTVSETTGNWRGAGGKLAQNCHVIPVQERLASRFPGVMHLDCDVGRGASGSAILTDVASGVPRYIGTTIAYSGNNCREAGLTTCYSIGRRLDADLIARIKGTTAIRLTPEDQALGATQDARLAAGRDAVAARALAALAMPFPARDDAEGRKAAELFTRIKQLLADGHPEQTDTLFLEAYRLLHDPAQSRPEWPWLLLENGESMLSQHRPADAFQCFHSGLPIAPDALKPYFLLRMAQTAIDQELRKNTLREAYLAGGDRLFEAAKADAELTEIRVKGILTADP